MRRVGTAGLSLVGLIMLMGQSDCASPKAEVLLVNDDTMPVHIFAAGESAGDSNRLEPGESREITIRRKNADGGVATFYAFRNDSELGSANCVLWDVDNVFIDDTVVWTGSALACQDNQDAQ